MFLSWLEGYPDPSQIRSRDSGKCAHSKHSEFTAMTQIRLRRNQKNVVPPAGRLLGIRRACGSTLFRGSRKTFTNRLTFHRWGSIEGLQCRSYSCK